MRTILDVICYHNKTNVSSTSSQISISCPFIFEIARLKNDELIYKEENISGEARLYFDNNRSKLHPGRMVRSVFSGAVIRSVLCRK